MSATRSSYLTSLLFLSIFILLPAATASAQDSTVILTGAQLTRVVPNSFYYAGQSAPTQLRNSAAARLAAKQYVIAGLVDTSGYSSEVRASYEGFLITDTPIRIGDSNLETGAYGFGFTNDGKLNIYDIGGRQVLSVATSQDKSLRRPRPLMMSKATNGVRLYSGRTYVNITAR